MTFKISPTSGYPRDFSGLECDQSLEFIRLHLEYETGKAASFKDVFDHIRERFPTGDPLAEYLEELYDTRIIVVHPGSRFGEYWAPPMAADDCYEAMDIAIYLYRYILLDEVWAPTDNI